MSLFTFYICQKGHMAPKASKIWPELQRWKLKPRLVGVEGSFLLLLLPREVMTAGVCLSVYKMTENVMNGYMKSSRNADVGK